MGDPLNNDPRQHIDGSHNIQAINSIVLSLSDGTPITSLHAPTRSDAATTAAWSAARLLKASNAVVKFVDRGSLLADLRSWCESDDNFAVKVVGGAGGTGKTRLAVELCLDLTDAEPGWRAGLVGAEMTAAEMDVVVRRGEPRLLVVDYAETRPAQVAQLLELASAQGTGRIRVLLLVRQPKPLTPREASGGASGWAQAVRDPGNDAANVVLDVATELVLDHADLGHDDRQWLFRSAVQAYRPAGSTIDASPSGANLGIAMFAQPLMVTIAAYLHAHGHEIPAASSELLDAVLAHEDHYWERQLPAGLTLSAVERSAAVALATLTDARDADDARALLRGVFAFKDEPDRELTKIDGWLRGLYPGGGSTRWAPLEPDIVGEHLVVTESESLTKAVATALDADREPDLLVRPLATITRVLTARPEPGIAEQLGRQIDEQLRSLAAAAASEAADRRRFDAGLIQLPTMLAGLVEARNDLLSLDSLMLASDALGQSHTTVLLHLALMESLIAKLGALPTSESTTAQRAAVLNNLGSTYANIGRHTDALPPTQEAVTLYRDLATPDSMHRPDLAKALINLGSCYANVGQHSEAISSMLEAIEILGEVPGIDPAIRLELAYAMDNLGNCYSAVGRDEDALKQTMTAAEILSELAAADSAYGPDLARCLTNLGDRYAELGRYDEGVPPALKAIRTLEELSDADPSHFPHLASALTNLGKCYAGLGHFKDALDTTQQANALFDMLSKDIPAFRPELAGTLSNLGDFYHHLGCQDEALTATADAVGIWRVLADANVVYQPDLAGALNKLGKCCAALGQFSEALDATGEAAEIFNHLAEASNTHQDQRDDALKNYSEYLGHVWRNREA